MQSLDLRSSGDAVPHKLPGQGFVIKFLMYCEASQSACDAVWAPEAPRWCHAQLCTTIPPDTNEWLCATLMSWTQPVKKDLTGLSIASHPNRPSWSATLVATPLWRDLTGAPDRIATAATLAAWKP